MNKRWRWHKFARELTVQIDAAVSAGEVLVVERPGHYRWAQVRGAQDVVEAELQGNGYIDTRDDRWTIPQLDRLISAGWELPSATPEQATRDEDLKPNIHRSAAPSDTSELALQIAEVFRVVQGLRDPGVLRVSTDPFQLRSSEVPAASARSETPTHHTPVGGSTTEFSAAAVGCGECGWTGPGSAARIGEYFGTGVEFNCPQCDAYFGFWSHPPAL